jgi:hypothetical protein
MRTQIIPAPEITVGHSIEVGGRWHRITRLTPYRGALPSIGGIATAYWPNPEGSGECGVSLFGSTWVEVLAEDGAP